MTDACTFYSTAEMHQIHFKYANFFSLQLSKYLNLKTNHFKALILYSISHCGTLVNTTVTINVFNSHLPSKFSVMGKVKSVFVFHTPNASKSKLTNQKTSEETVGLHSSTQ